MNWSRPEFLYGLLVLPLLGVLFLLRVRTMKAFVSRYQLDRVSRRLPVDRRFFRNLFLLIALGGLLLALATPRFGVALEQGERKGRDIYLVVDVSRSMNARDLRPSRLAVTKQMIYDLLSRMENDRVGVIVFAGDAFVLCPLTTDYEAVTMFVDGMDTEMTSAYGTNLGAALRLAVASFPEADSGYRTVLVFSDGEDFGGEVEDGIRAAVDNETLVFAVGIGSPEGAPVPELDANGQVVSYKKDESGDTVISRLNGAALKRIAERTGGAYFHAASNQVALELSERINRLSRRKLEEKGFVRLRDRYQLPLGLALVAMAGFLLL